MNNIRLSARQARFIDEYLVDGNGAQAAIRAGYAPGSAKVAACRLLTGDNPVKRAVEARQAADAQRLGATRQEVVAGLWSAFQLARGQHDPATMVRAAAEVAKMLGFYEPGRASVQMDVTSYTGAERMDQLSNAQLAEIVAASAAG